MRLAIFLLGVLLLYLPAAGVAAQDESELERRAQKVDRSLICPVCPGETIDQSQVQLAKQMQAVVREKLQEGWTEGQIRDFFVERYGESVLAAPPKEGFNLIAWIVPPLGVAVGLLTLFLVIREMRRRRPVLADTPTRDTEDVAASGLEPYLAMVDHEMSAFGASPTSKPPPPLDEGAQDKRGPRREEA